jgi:hypothetical protein
MSAPMLRRKGASPDSTAGRSAMSPILPVLLFVLAAVAVAASGSATQVNLAIFWGSIALASYLAGIFVLLFARAKAFAVFDMRLGVWFLAYAVVAFGLATLTIMAPQVGTTALVDKEKVPQALLLIGLSFTMWAVGYALGKAQIMQAPFAWGKSVLTARLSSEIRSPGALYAVFALGVAADLLTVVLSGRYGYLGDASTVSIDSVSWYTQPLVLVSGFKNIALFGLGVRVFVSKSDGFVRVLLPLLAVAIAMSLLTGMKEAFIIPLLSVGVPYLVGRVRGRVVVLLGALLIFMFVVTPVVSAFRGDLRNSSGTLDVVSALSLGVENIFSTKGYLENANASTGPSTAERIRIVDNLTIIMDKTPDEIAYRSFDEVVAAPLAALIPRLLWPNKPVRISGYEFYQSYYQGTTESSSAITLQGSLYLYGGAWVLILGMLLVGFVMRAVDEVLDARRNLHGMLLFVLVAVVVTKQEMDVASFLASLPLTILSWFLGARLIFSKSSSQSSHLR